MTEQEIRRNERERVAKRLEKKGANIVAAVVRAMPDPAPAPLEPLEQLGGGNFNDISRDCIIRALVDRVNLLSERSKP